jgi:hypothetical protein
MHKGSRKTHYPVLRNSSLKSRKRKDRVLAIYRDLWWWWWFINLRRQQVVSVARLARLSPAAKIPCLTELGGWSKLHDG